MSAATGAQQGLGAAQCTQFTKLTCANGCMVRHPLWQVPLLVLWNNIWHNQVHCSKVMAHEMPDCGHSIGDTRPRASHRLASCCQGSRGRAHSQLEQAFTTPVCVLPFMLLPRGRHTT